MTIYKTLKEAQCELGNNCSDLHVKATAPAVSIITAYRNNGKPLRWSYFKSNIDGGMWIEIPFAYDPFWQEVEKKII